MTKIHTNIHQIIAGHYRHSGVGDISCESGLSPRLDGSQLARCNSCQGSFCCAAVRGCAGCCGPRVYVSTCRHAAGLLSGVFYSSSTVYFQWWDCSVVGAFAEVSPHSLVCVRARGGAGGARYGKLHYATPRENASFGPKKPRNSLSVCACSVVLCCVRLGELSRTLSAASRRPWTHPREPAGRPCGLLAAGCCAASCDHGACADRRRGSCRSFSPPV